MTVLGCREMRGKGARLIAENFSGGKKKRTQRPEVEEKEEKKNIALAEKR